MWAQLQGKQRRLALCFQPQERKLHMGSPFHWRNVEEIKRQESGTNSPAGTQNQMDYKGEAEQRHLADVGPFASEACFVNF